MEWDKNDPRAGLRTPTTRCACIACAGKNHASCAPSTRRLIRSPYSWPVGGMNRIYRARQQKCLMLIVGGWTIVEAVFLYQPAKRATFFPRFAGCLGHIALVPRN
jgi:hypothetical protein